MQLHNIFSTPIWIDHLTFDFNSVATKCELMKDDGVKISNVGGFQSKPIQVNQFQEFYPLLLSKLDEVCNQIDPNFKLLIDGAWVNINQKGDFNIPHFHPASTLSAVLYIKVDDLTGNIRFTSNSLMEHYPINPFKSELFQLYTDVKPKNGTLVVFPSWLKHSVLQSTSDSTRISIAINTIQI